MCRFGVPLAPIAEPVDGPWANGVRLIAADTGITVIAGMFTPAEDGRVTNTLIATGRGVDAHYHKIHLYDAFGFTESRTVAPGREPVTISVDGVDVGLTTCYDIRFPGLYVELARRGAQLITVSASWGAGPGKLEQWKLLAWPARSTPRATSPLPDRPTRAGPTQGAAGRRWQPGGLAVRRGGGVGGRPTRAGARRHRPRRRRGSP